MDCMDALDSIADSSADLVILDPDYNDWSELIRRGIIEKCMRILKDSGNMILFTKQPFDYELRIKVNDWFRREIAWSFCNGGAWVSNKMPLVSFQKIFWLVKGKNFYFNPRTGFPYSESTRDFKRKNKVFDGYDKEGREFSRSAEGVWLRDHLHFDKPSMGSIPAKPEDLIKIIVRCFSPKNALVVDPFIGSGTTALTCLRENRHFIGFEIDKARCEKAKNRIWKEFSQQTLF